MMLNYDRQCCFILLGDLNSENRIEISHELMKLGFGKAHTLRICKNIRNIFLLHFPISGFAAMQKYNKTWIA